MYEKIFFSRIAIIMYEFWFKYMYVIFWQIQVTWLLNLSNHKHLTKKLSISAIVPYL
jgi:hypothetical protein